jgi:hypothetical protein
MKELTYTEVGKELGVHPYHVRRIARRYPKIMRPIVHGYNRITFRFTDVQRVKRQRERDAIKAFNHQRKLRRVNGGAR